MATFADVGVQLHDISAGYDLSSSADTFSNHGLDFRSVARQLSNGRGGFARSERSARQDSSSVYAGQLYFSDLLNSTAFPKHTASSPERLQDTGMRGKVTFVCGYPESAQLATLLNNSRLGLEAWRRHIGTLFGKPYTEFEDTKLPSVAYDIIRLRFWTMGSRSDDVVNTRQAVDLLRRDAASLMAAYRDRLRENVKWRPGDSIVRRYEVHDQTYFSIEQFVTIYVSTFTETVENRDRHRWHGMQTLLFVPKWVLTSDCSCYIL